MGTRLIKIQKMKTFSTATTALAFPYSIFFEKGTEQEFQNWNVPAVIY